jgi:hypothetical protein
MKSQRFDMGELQAPVKREDGTIRADARLTRSGVFLYRNSDGSLRREFRPPSEVFDAASLESLRMVPVTMDHPRFAVDASNARKFAVGTTGQDVRQDGSYVRSTIAVNDQASITQMEAGKNQLSCGYHCTLDFTEGVTEDGERYDAIQRGIVYNHVAIVDRGRAGPDVNARIDEWREECLDVGVQVEDEAEEAPQSAPDAAESKEDAETYTPTAAMARNARRALEAREEKPPSQRGMTAVGLTRARQLINREPISLETVRRMKAFFDRHEVDKQGATWGDQGKGWQAWHGWGGDEGYAWATRIVEQANRGDTQQPKDCDSFSPEHDKSPERRRNGDMMEFTIKIDGVEYALEGDKSAKQAFDKHQDAADAQVKDLQEKIDAAEAKADAAQAKADAAEAKVEKLEKERADVEAGMADAVKARVALEKDAAKVLGDDFKADATDAEIKRAVADKAYPGKCEGKSDAYVDALFDLAVTAHDEAQAKEAEAKADAAEAKENACNADSVEAPLNKIEQARKDRDERNASRYLSPVGAHIGEDGNLKNKL